MIVRVGGKVVAVERKRKGNAVDFYPKPFSNLFARRDCS